MSRIACTILIVVVAAIVLSGCSEGVRPKDIAMAEAMCKDYKGLANLQTSGSLYYSNVKVICMDGSILERTYPRKGDQ